MKQKYLTEKVLIGRLYIYNPQPETLYLIVAKNQYNPSVYKVLDIKKNHYFYVGFGFFTKEYFTQEHTFVD